MQPTFIKIESLLRDLQKSPEQIIVVVKAIPDPAAHVPELGAADVEQTAVDERSRKLGQHAQRDSADGKREGLNKKIKVKGAFK